MIRTIGDRVRKLREERRLSQEALGDLVGVTKSAINRLENGSTKAPTPETLFGLADVFGVSARELALGKKGHIENTESQFHPLFSSITPKQLTLLKIVKDEPESVVESLISFLLAIKKYQKQ